jgi:OmcA/MtrC family decaheme c-type cytochrome
MTSRATWLAAVALAITAAGCSGSDGSAGPQGPQGAQGPQGPQGQLPLTAEACIVCHGAGQVLQADLLHDTASAIALARGTATFLDADFTPVAATTVVKPTIRFQVRNAAGVFVDNWEAFNFTIAKLVPATATVPEHWQAFIYANGVPSREAAGAKISGATAGATLTFDAPSHTYTYRFATDIAAVAPPGASYTQGDTIRIGFQVTTYVAPNPTPTFDMTNGFADFTSAAAPAAPTTLQRDIVRTDTCNNCHHKLTVHGRRVEVPYCTTCHNAGLSDANGVGDLTQFIHKLHGRDKLRSPTTPIFAGVVPQEITYPQDIIHCATCHAGGADSTRWKTNPSRYACSSCHDDITFDAALVTTVVRLHTGGARANDSLCASCHDPDVDGIAPSMTNAHTSQVEVQASHFKPVLTTVTPRSGKYPTIKFSIVDPLSASSAYPLSSGAFTQGGNSTLSMVVAFANTDFSNEGGTFAQPLSVNVLGLTPGGAPNASGQQLSAQLVDGSYVLTIDQALPAFVTSTSGSVDGTVSLQGHPAGAPPVAGSRLPMVSASKAFRAKGTGTATARRAVVDVARCNVCHFNLSLHGNNRTSDITTCVMCHNPDASDGSRRPNFTTPGALGIDGKLEEGIDFKYLIHKIHGHGTGPEDGIVVYGFGGSVNDFREVTYPGVKQHCQACHLPTPDVEGATATYLQPLTTAKGTTTFAGASRTASSDNLRRTKYSATCGGCHDSAAPAAHIKQMGGAVDVTQSQIDAVNQ